MKEKFVIEDKQLFSRETGEPTDLVNSVIIRVLPYSIYQHTVTAYIEYFNSNGTTSSIENKTIPVPENWGIDNMVVVQAFADFLDLVIVQEEEVLEVITD